jgi:hypothetical protein
MTPTSKRLLLRPSVETRIQLDRVELLCISAEPIPRCQRRPVQNGVPVVVTPSRRPDPNLTHSSPNAAFHPTKSGWRWPTHIHLIFSRPLSDRSQPTSRKQGQSPPHAHSTNRPSRVRTTQFRELSCRRRTLERACRGREPRANRTRCGGSGWQSSLGLTAQRTLPASRWLRRGRGSSISHAWAINEPLRTANASHPGSATSADASMPACRRNDPELPLCDYQEVSVGRFRLGQRSVVTAPTIWWPLSTSGIAGHRSNAPQGWLTPNDHTSPKPS